MNETFICYSRKDKAFVDQLVKSLKVAGIDPWIDTDDISPAGLWKQEVLVAIQFCHNFLYIISPASVKSEYCNAELEHALALNKRVIPVLAIETNSLEVRPSVRELNFISFNEPTLGIKALLEVIDSPMGLTHGDRLDACIQVVTGDALRQFYLYRNQYVIGRNPQGDFAETGLIFLGDSTVSRAHLTIKRSDNRWVIYDGLVTFNGYGNPKNVNPSRNGTRLRGGLLQPFKGIILRHRDIIVISTKTKLIYEELEPINYEEIGMIRDNRDTDVN